MYGSVRCVRIFILPLKSARYYEVLEPIYKLHKTHVGCVTFTYTHTNTHKQLGVRHEGLRIQKS
jgi:hypothetical protein